jgi:hypothetical protein
LAGHNCFCKKSMSKTFYKKIDKKFHVSFYTTFYFVVFLGVSQRGESETTIFLCVKNIFSPVTFLASDLPTYPRGSPLFLPGPCTRISTRGVRRPATATTRGGSKKKRAHLRQLAKKKYVSAFLFCFAPP